MEVNKSRGGNSYDTEISFKGQRTTTFQLMGSRGGDKEYG